ncbi:MAG TPA: hypothetical protein GXZ74_08235 [Tissierellia bacterium]|nr:hypothetical protein [Tissierellia bacterium]
MKRYYLILILISLIASGCSANAAETVMPAAESPTETVEPLAEVIDRPIKPRPPSEPVEPLPPIREKDPPIQQPEVPISGNESLVSVWSDMAMDDQGYPFLFSLPFDRLTIKSETGHLSLTGEEADRSITLTKDALSQGPPAIYWRPANEVYRDTLHIELSDLVSGADYSGQIHIERTHRPTEGMDVYLARFQYSQLILYPSPISRATVISLPVFTKIVYETLELLAPEQKDKITALPWIEPLRASQEITGATFEQVPANAGASYRLSFATSDDAGQLVVYYDSIHQSILGYGLSD